MSKSNKNKKKRPQQHPPQAEANEPQAVPQSQSNGSATPSASQTPEAALALIKATNEIATAEATDTDVEVAVESPSVTDPTSLDLVAAAKLVDETLALCRAREQRVAEREAQLEMLEQEALARAQELETRVEVIDESEQDLKTRQAALVESERNHQSRTSSLDAREEAIVVRELNAEAGFAAQRRASLEQLEGEARTLRQELSAARARIAEERAAWEALRRSEEERQREEHKRAIADNQSALDAARLELEEQLRTERQQLSDERKKLKKRADQIEHEQEILQEDRAAFDARVAARSARDLEAAEGIRKDLEARLAIARTGREQLYEKLRDRDEAERALGNRPLPEVKKELDDLLQERDRLKEQLAQRPSQDVTERLAGLERAREEWEAERGRLTQEVVAARNALAKASIAVTELETLRDQKAALESGRDLMHAALEELRKDVDERIRRADGVSPFPACSQMDTNAALQTRTQMIEEVSDLKAFCADLQHRIAIDPENTAKVLRYELRDIRCFLGGLAMSRLHLLQGISGTGKTSLPLAVARALGAGSTLVEIQAGWRDRQDLVGHFNAFEKRFYESEFLQALYRAQCPGYADRPYIVVLDEMNLSHPEQYFADLLSALEQDPGRQKLDLMTAAVDPAPTLLRNGRTLAIPPNVWFVGTANHDETTKDFADKTYDRAHMMELPRHRAQFQPKKLTARAPVSFRALQASFVRAQEDHRDKAKSGYAFLDESFGEILGSRFGVGWGNRLERQMLDFVPVVIATGGTLEEAVDHILATKLLRKVRDKHDTRPEDFTALRERMEEAWPALGSPADAKTSRSMDMVRTELRRLGAEEKP